MSAAGSNVPIEVAVGILEDAQGRVLIAQRPIGKAYAGYWEFPGGKIESGETVERALARELHEELGVQVQVCEPLLTLVHRYPEYTVRLQIRRVRGFSGEARSREQQALSWVNPDELNQWRLLPADGPVVQAIRQPPHYVFTPSDWDVNLTPEALDSLPERALLRLRLPALSDEQYGQMAAEVLPWCQVRNLTLMLDRGPELVERLGGCGLHYTEQALQGAAARSRLPAHWTVAGSVHDAEGLALAAERADLAVLGPVLATQTHPQAQGLGWPQFSGLCESARLPVYAIGGVSVEQVSHVRSHGGQGVAGIRTYWSGGSRGGSASSKSSAVSEGKA